ncbi:MAG: hypothetical protein E6G92_13955 [Alphaproteobacteria bacterium]|nr:MAG: hypothetical protein E6G92_13955 [Alphaproteobacteria bacterium]
MAILPTPEGRTAERRIVNLAARLREPGASIFDAEVMNLSTDGFMATVPNALEAGTIVWLRLPGLEPQNSRVVWCEDGKAGFQFTNPIHPATIDLLVQTNRKAPPKRHFGPQG